MPNQKIAGMSENEEMYLVTVAKLVESGLEGPITVSQLAQELSILPISANQMIRKLADEGFVKYLPYKGVELLPAGLRLAQHVLRYRRLWEVFLVEHLELPTGEADALACRLEHITPRDVAERLYNYLGQPTVSPQGRPIPRGDEEAIVDLPRPLNTLKVGQRAEVMCLTTETGVTAFLQAEGIKPGVQLAMLGIGDQGSLLLRAGERQITISGTIAEGILVNNLIEITNANSTG